HVAVRILEFYGGIVHQDADGQRHAAQGHDVDGFADQAQDGQRGQDGERNRNAHDDGAAPTAQEEQDHHCREKCSDGGFPNHAIDGRAHEQRLIEQLADVQFGRQSGQDPGKPGFDRVHDRERGRPAIAQYRHEGSARAVGAHDAGLDGIPVADLRHIFDVYRGAIDYPDGEVIQFIEQLGAAIDLDLIVDLPDLGCAGGQDDALRAHGVGDIRGRDAFGVKLVGVQIDHDHAELAAVRERNGGALDGRQLGADEIEAEIENILFAESLAFQSQLQDRHAGGVVFEDVGREGPRREDAEKGLRNGRNLGQGHVDLDVRLEVNADHRDAGVGLRLDVLDIVDRGRQGPFEDGDQSFFHLLWGQALVGPDDADHRYIDIREDIDGHGDDGRPAEDGDEHGHDDEGIGAP